MELLFSPLSLVLVEGTLSISNKAASVFTRCLLFVRPKCVLFSPLCSKSFEFESSDAELLTSGGLSLLDFDSKTALITRILSLMLETPGERDEKGDTFLRGGG